MKAMAVTLSVSLPNATKSIERQKINCWLSTD